jgi:hypothetical protein
MTSRRRAVLAGVLALDSATDPRTRRWLRAIEFLDVAPP